MIKKNILVTGSNGLLGQKIIYELVKRNNVNLIASSRGNNRLVNKSGYNYIDLDITNKKDVDKVILEIQPHAVINCAAMTNVDACENNKKACWDINVNAVEYLA